MDLTHLGWKLRPLRQMTEATLSTAARPGFPTALSREFRFVVHRILYLIAPSHPGTSLSFGLDANGIIVSEDLSWRRASPVSPRRRSKTKSLSEREHLESISFPQMADSAL